MGNETSRGAEGGSSASGSKKRRSPRKGKKDKKKGSSSAAAAEKETTENTVPTRTKSAGPVIGKKPPPRTSSLTTTENAQMVRQSQTSSVDRSRDDHTTIGIVNVVHDSSNSVIRSALSADSNDSGVSSISQGRDARSVDTGTSDESGMYVDVSEVMNFAHPEPRQFVEALKFSPRASAARKATSFDEAVVAPNSAKSLPASRRNDSKLAAGRGRLSRGTSLVKSYSWDCRNVMRDEQLPANDTVKEMSREKLLAGMPTIQIFREAELGENGETSFEQNDSQDDDSHEGEFVLNQAVPVTSPLRGDDSLRPSAGAGNSPIDSDEHSSEASRNFFPDIDTIVSSADATSCKQGAEEEGQPVEFIPFAPENLSYTPSIQQIDEASSYTRIPEQNGALDAPGTESLPLMGDSLLDDNDTRLLSPNETLLVLAADGLSRSEEVKVHDDTRIAELNQERGDPATERLPLLPNNNTLLKEPAATTVSPLIDPNKVLLASAAGFTQAGKVNDTREPEQNEALDVPATESLPSMKGSDDDSQILSQDEDLADFWAAQMSPLRDADVHGDSPMLSEDEPLSLRADNDRRINQENGTEDLSSVETIAPKDSAVPNQKQALSPVASDGDREAQSPHAEADDRPNGVSSFSEHSLTDIPRSKVTEPKQNDAPLHASSQIPLAEDTTPTQGLRNELDEGLSAAVVPSSSTDGTIVSEMLLSEKGAERESLTPAMDENTVTTSCEDAVTLLSRPLSGEIDSFVDTDDILISTDSFDENDHVGLASLSPEPMVDEEQRADRMLKSASVEDKRSASQPDVTDRERDEDGEQPSLVQGDTLQPILSKCEAEHVYDVGEAGILSTGTHEPSAIVRNCINADSPQGQDNTSEDPFAVYDSRGIQRAVVGSPSTRSHDSSMYYDAGGSIQTEHTGEVLLKLHSPDADWGSPGTKSADDSLYYDMGQHLQPDTGIGVESHGDLNNPLHRSGGSDATPTKIKHIQGESARDNDFGPPSSVTIDGPGGDRPESAIDSVETAINHGDTDSVETSQNNGDASSAEVAAQDNENVDSMKGAQDIGDADLVEAPQEYEGVSLVERAQDNEGVDPVEVSILDGCVDSLVNSADNKGVDLFEAFQDSESTDSVVAFVEVSQDNEGPDSVEAVQDNEGVDLVESSQGTEGPDSVEAAQDSEGVDSVVDFVEVSQDNEGTDSVVDSVEAAQDNEGTNSVEAVKDSKGVDSVVDLVEASQGNEGTDSVEAAQDSEGVDSVVEAALDNEGTNSVDSVIIDSVATAQESQCVGSVEAAQHKGADSVAGPQENEGVNSVEAAQNIKSVYLVGEAQDNQGVDSVVDSVATSQVNEGVDSVKVARTDDRDNPAVRTVDLIEVAQENEVVDNNGDVVSIERAQANTYDLTLPAGLVTGGPGKNKPESANPREAENRCDIGDGASDGLLVIKDPSASCDSKLEASSDAEKTNFIGATDDFKASPESYNKEVVSDDKLKDAVHKSGSLEPLSASVHTIAAASVAGETSLVEIAKTVASQVPVPSEASGTGISDKVTAVKRQVLTSSGESSQADGKRRRSAFGFSVRGGWKGSLNRFATAAASTAASAAQAAAPVLVEASTMATEIAGSYRSDTTPKRSKQSSTTEIPMSHPSAGEGIADQASVCTSALSTTSQPFDDKTKQRKVPASPPISDEESMSSSSLSRFASAAISTAGSVAKVARPILSEAGMLAADVVVPRQQTSILVAPYVAVEKLSGTETLKVARETGKAVAAGTVPPEVLLGVGIRRREVSATIDLPNKADAEHNRPLVTSHTAASPISITAAGEEDSLGEGAKVPYLSGQRTDVRDAFRRTDDAPPLQINFHSSNMHRNTKSDAVSLSSASSTISPGSTTKGILSSGVATPARGPRMSVGSERGSNVDTRPPLFPKKTRDVANNPSKFVEFISKKLAAHQAATKQTDEKEPGDNRWMKQSRVTSFDPNESVFARARLPPSSSLSLSPPDSPPEPTGDDSELDETSADGSKDNLSRFASLESRAELALWDMISVKHSPPKPIGASTAGERPDYVVLPGSTSSSRTTPQDIAEEWGVLNSPAASELGSSSRARNRLGDVSFSSSKRRTRIAKGFSITSRGSSRRSLLSRAFSRKRINQKSVAELSIWAARSEELPPLFSPKYRDESETLSLDGRTFSPDSRYRNNRYFQPPLDRSLSLPDLRFCSPISLSARDSSPVVRSPLESPDGSSTSTALLFHGRSPNQPCPTLSREVVANGRYPDAALGISRIIPDTPAADTFIPSPSLMLSAASVAQFSAPERIFVFPPYEEVMLEGTLLAFSSVQSVRFPWRRLLELDDSLEYLAFVRWRQLVANIKHREMMNFVKRRYSMSSSNLQRSLDDALSASASTGYPKQNLTKIELCGLTLVEGSGLDGLGYNTSSDHLTNFLSEMGSLTVVHASVLRHEVDSDARTHSSIHELLRVAESELSRFSAFVHEIAAFASRNEAAAAEDELEPPYFSVGLKLHQAIENKAKRKYGGDFLQVKDVLRGQIVFPDEASLVCALVYLNRISSRGMKNTDEIKFDLVRFKNSFVESSCDIELPTGYGHVLLSIRLSGGLLAGTFTSSSLTFVSNVKSTHSLYSSSEIQCHLSTVFDILGSEGYLLHREIIELQDALSDGLGEDNDSATDCLSPFDIEPLIAETDSRRFSVEDASTDVVKLITEAAIYHPDLPFEDTKGVASSTSPVSQTVSSYSRTTWQGSDEEPRVFAHEDGDLLIAPEFEEKQSKMDSKSVVRNPSSTYIEDDKASGRPATIPEDRISDSNEHQTEAITVDAIVGEKQITAEVSEGSTLSLMDQIKAASAADREEKKAAPDSTRLGLMDQIKATVTASLAENARDVSPPGTSRLTTMDQIKASRAPTGAREEEKKTETQEESLPTPTAPETKRLGLMDQIKAAASATVARDEEKVNTHDESMQSPIRETHAATSDSIHSSVPATAGRTLTVSTSFDHVGPTASFSEANTPRAAGRDLRHVDTASFPGGLGLSETIVETRSPVTTPERQSQEYLGTRAGNFAESIERKKALVSINAKSREWSETDFYAAVLRRGAQTVLENPRDVPSFVCMHALFSFLSDSDRFESLGLSDSDEFASRQDMMKYSQQCLFRCWIISNQAASTGMMGWMEFDSDHQPEKDIERPLAFQYEIACKFAHRRMWTDAEDILKDLIMSRELHFSPVHPLTLATLLDFAAVCSARARDELVTRTIARVSQRLCSYLSEMEDKFLSRRDENLTDSHTKAVMFRTDHDRKWLSMLTGFVSSFQSHLDREMVRIIGHDHDIALVHHCFLADSIAVLANCVATAKAFSLSTGSSDPMDQDHYWRQAFLHYQYALKGFTRTKGLGHQNVAAAAYGAARCLRELGRTGEALEILSTVVEVSEHALLSKTIFSTVKSTPPGDEAKTSFLPQRCFRQHKKVSSGKRLSSGLCYWLMAALTADTKIDDEGRDRSLGLLRAASKSVQAGLSEIHEDDKSTRATYIDVLERIEEEAKHILELFIKTKDGSSQSTNNAQRDKESRRAYPVSPPQQPSLWSV